MLKGSGLNTTGLVSGGVLSALAQTSAFQLVLPAKGVIQQILVRNSTANAITGGLKVGSSSGAVDIVAALAVAGNFIGNTLDAALLKRFFSVSASQTLFFDAVTLWNSATIDLYVPYIIMP